MSSPLMIQGPAGYDPILGEMRTNNFSGGGSGAVMPGYRMNDSGGMLNQDRYFPIETVTGSTVTMQAGHAYSINATSGAIVLNCETFSASRFGLEGHLQIFTANTGYIQAGANVYLKEALEPDSINNCTVRFHGGSATISVEDHLGGYIVISGGTATGSGSLPYGLASAASSYIAFSDIPELTGVPITMGGVVTNGEKHVVGNGYADTILTGGVSCTSKTTFAYLTMSGVSALAGTMILADVNIPSGATVAVSGGGLSVEKVTGDGGTIDLGGTRIEGYTPYTMQGVTVTGATSYAAITRNISGAVITDCTFTGNIGGGAFFAAQGATAQITSCVFSGNSNTLSDQGGAITVVSGASVSLSGSTITDNLRAGAPWDIAVMTGGLMTLTDCMFDGLIVDGATASLAGQNKINNRIIFYTGTRPATVVISSGAIIDLTGNTNATPINPGGGVTFEQGGATVYPSAGQASAYMLGGVTVPTIGNTNVVNLSGTRIEGYTPYTMQGVTVTGATSYAAITRNISGAVITDCTFTGNIGGGAFFAAQGATAQITSCVFSGNSNTLSDQGGAITVVSGASVSLSGSTITDNLRAGAPWDIAVMTGGLMTLTDCMFDGLIVDGATASLAGQNKINNRIIFYTGTRPATVVISSGAIIDLTGNTNATPINPGGGVIVDDGCTVINSAGASVSITGGTYAQINNDGTTA